MAQTTSRPKHSILRTLESALDDDSDYIGSAVWRNLIVAYEQTDSDVVDLQQELDEAKSLIDELEDQIRRLEGDAA